MRLNPIRAALYTILFITTINSCAQLSALVTVGPVHDGIDPVIQPYIDKVKAISDGCLGHKTKYAAFVTNLEDRVIGRASFVLPYITPQILLSDYYWIRLNERQRFLLVAHEMYHAEKPFFGHVHTKDEWGCYTHFMAPESQSNYCDMLYLDQYIKQMRFCK